MSAKTRIMIVDDSNFSITLLKNLLEERGFEVVGSASNLKEVKERTIQLKPDLVTMDMTLPSTDGLECTRAIHEIDKDIKVIIISSMMDDEIIFQAKRNHVSGYLQKPIEPEELELLINRIMASKELFLEFERSYADIFKESLSRTFMKMLKKTFPIEEANKIEHCYNSFGMTGVISVAGKYTGRIIFDTSEVVARKLASTMLHKEELEEGEILECISELVNIFAGNACSLFNRSNKLYGLRVTPPTIFYGEQVCITKTDLATEVAFNAITSYGAIYFNVGFKRGEAEWTQSI